MVSSVGTVLVNAYCRRDLKRILTIAVMPYTDEFAAPPVHRLLHRKSNV
jgi:hypothetical protein